MQKTFLLLLLTLGSFAGQAQPNSYLQETQTRLENAKKSTLQLAETMPETEYGFKPVPDEMSFRAQLLHMAQNLSNLTSSYLTTQPNPLPKELLNDMGQSKAEVMQRIATAFDYAIEAVRGFDEANLEQRVSFFAGPLSKRQIMQLLNDHQTHHRGQLVVYLRLKGLKPPAYVGW